MSGLPAKLALAVFALLASVAALEVAARFVVTPTRIPANPIYIPHPHLVYTGNPARGHTRDGFTGPERPLKKPPRTIRVACVGGSTTYGANWPGLLEKKLNEGFQGDDRSFEVLNFGMSGYTSLESMINLAINIQDYEIDYLVIHHALNDLMPRLYAEMERDYGHFRKIYEPHGAVVRYLSGRSALFVLLSRRLGLRFSLADATMTVNDENPANPFRPDALNPDGSIFQRNLETMISIARGAGIEPVLTTMPYSLDPTKLPAEWAIRNEVKLEGMKDHNRIIRLVAGERGVLLVDLDRQMTGNERYFFDHVHCLGPGRSKKAELVGDALLAAVAGPGREDPSAAGP